MRIASLSDGGSYDVIYADPPWRFKPLFKGASYSNDQENHYPTMSLDDICALPVPAAKSSALYLWVTSPHLDQGLRVMREWGFTYKASAVWVKPSPGTGYWWRNQHELLLVGNRGKWPAPKPRDRAASLYQHPRTKHSEKPHEVRDHLAAWWPDARRLEMFARTSADGWDTWGNQAPDTREPTYGMCLHCGSVEVVINRVSGTRDLSIIGESATYPTGLTCEMCA